MSRRRIAASVGVLLAVAVAGPAQAAFAPRLSVTVNPATSVSPAALAVEVTQESGEEATRSLRVALPSFSAGRKKVSGRGRGLAPGWYLLTVRAATTDGSAAKTLGLRVAARRP